MYSFDQSKADRRPLITAVLIPSIYRYHFNSIACKNYEAILGSTLLQSSDRTHVAQDSSSDLTQ
jgi:hypothetical protein